MRSWKHSGFNLHCGEKVEFAAQAVLEELAQYILRNPFSVEKMTLESPTDNVIYRSRMNPRIHRNFEVFTPTDFLANITQHIPDKGAQMVRYYGWYSNKMRGVRRRTLPLSGAQPPGQPFRIPPPPLRLPSKKWRDLIMKVWHTDPLQCPICGQAMRVIALIDQKAVIEVVTPNCCQMRQCFPVDLRPRAGEHGSVNDGSKPMLFSAPAQKSNFLSNV